MPLKVWIGLGSNLGDRVGNLNLGAKYLAEVGKIDCLSSIYEAEAWGDEVQPDFLNAVCQITTECDNPHEFLEVLKNIEKQAGRVPAAKKWAPRILDLDILFWGDKIVESEGLIIPHPLIPVRRFVLEPLAQIAPDLIHPLLKLTINELLINCADRSSVREYGTLNIPKL